MVLNFAYSLVLVFSCAFILCWKIHACIPAQGLIVCVLKKIKWHLRRVFTEFQIPWTMFRHQFDVCRLKAMTESRDWGKMINQYRQTFIAR